MAPRRIRGDRALVNRAASRLGHPASIAGAGSDRGYNEPMERTALDSLQARVDAIKATGDDDLAARAWHALSRVLFDHLRERMPEPNATDVRLYLSRARGDRAAHNS